jgi:class II lanthipeptide synthase
MIGSMRRNARTGFHGGGLGVVWGVAHAAAIVGDAELLHRVIVVVHELFDCEVTDAGYHDVVSGNAGAILALLGLHQLLDERAFLDQAARYGDALLASAEPSGDGLCWPATRQAGDRVRRGITGFAHGAAGVGLALLELYAVTGAKAYCEGAQAAFAFERLWFNDAAGNWQDLRIGHRRGDSASFATAWCHGAPGIAISRLRAQSLLDDERAAQEARRALATTWRHLEPQLGCPGMDISLCHGILGAATVIAHGVSRLGANTGYLPKTDELHRRLVSHLVADQAYWRADGGTMDALETGRLLREPGLLTGKAGVAYYAVRQLHRSLPCPLTMTQGVGAEVCPEREEGLM